MFSNSVLLLAAATILQSAISSGSPSCTQSDLTVEIPDGVVHATVDSATPHVRQFFGIPYAKPPLGNLRFAPPQASGPFGEINVTQVPPSCMQYLPDLPGITIDLVLEFNQGGLNVTGPITEDCLTLSVWAPRGNKAILPVFVFFYGGTFKAGGQNVPYQLPAEWIERSQDHIVVTLNYRVNIFGFPNAAGLPDDQQNLGLLDQRLAVEWVRDNIAAFGGDPTRIGLWGQSAGAISVAYYSYNYPKDPIVSSLIMDSGNELLDITTTDPEHSNFTFVASQFGCGGLDATSELTCMRAVDAYALEEFMQARWDNKTTPALAFAPIVDETTVFSNYSARALAGQVATLPTILGSNAHDGASFVAFNPDGVNETAAFQATLAYFFCPAWKSATTRIAAGAKVWRYEYAGNFSNISPTPWVGAYHDSELPLVFGTHPLYRGPSTPLEYQTSHAIQDAWVAFVSSGEAGLTSQDWPVYDERAGGLLREFGSGIGAQSVSYSTWETMCAAQYQP